MATTFQRLTHAIALLPQREQTLRLTMLLTLTRPHELLDPRTRVERHELVVCGRRRVPLGTAAATVVGGTGRVRGLLGLDGATTSELRSACDGLDCEARDSLSAAGLHAAVEAAHTSELRAAVIAYAGLKPSSSDLQPVAELLDDLARNAGYNVPATPHRRHLEPVRSGLHLLGPGREDRLDRPKPSAGG